MRWPDPWPGDYLQAMRACTFAFDVGRGREFAMQAFRNAFQRGTDLAIPGRVLETAMQAGFDRGEIERAMRDPHIKATLREATDAAYERGVFGVPTLAIGEELFWGDDRLLDAVGHLQTVMTV
jgi:2-hydroxychromene-2-carboxylate isomerase